MPAPDSILAQPWLWFALGAILLAYFVHRAREASKERLRRQEARAISREFDEERARRRAADEAAAEKHRIDMEAATLYGEQGESVADAAARLGIEIRRQSEDEWLGRRGDDGYRAEPAASQAVFYKIDPDERIPVERLTGLEHEELWSRLLAANVGDDVAGCKILEIGTEELSYDRQRYDGDFAHYVVVADPIGRRVHLNDHGEAVWRLDYSVSTATPKWEW